MSRVDFLVRQFSKKKICSREPTSCPFKLPFTFKSNEINLTSKCCAVLHWCVTKKQRYYQELWLAKLSLLIAAHSVILSKMRAARMLYLPYSCWLSGVPQTNYHFVFLYGEGQFLAWYILFEWGTALSVDSPCMGEEGWCRHCLLVAV